MSEDLLINPDDFKSAQIKINLANTTTGTDFIDSHMRYGSSGVQGKPKKLDFEIKMTELLDHGFKLEIPAKFCSKGHNGLAELHVIYQETELKFEASGKIVHTENIDPNTDEIEFKIQQIDEDTWRQFKQLYADRQKDILEFFEAVRGY